MKREERNPPWIHLKPPEVDKGQRQQAQVTQTSLELMEGCFKKCPAHVSVADLIFSDEMVKS